MLRRRPPRPTARPTPGLLLRATSLSATVRSSGQNSDLDGRSPRRFLGERPPLFLPRAEPLEAAANAAGLAAHQREGAHGLVSIHEPDSQSQGVSVRLASVAY